MLTLLYLTCPNKDEALRIAQKLIAARLIACANILPNMTSVYEWQGELCVEEEVVLILKSTLDKFEAIREEVLRLHSYEIPCILSLPVLDAHAPYRDWLLERLAGGTGLKME